MPRPALRAPVLATLLGLVTGCAPTRVLGVTSDPPGALVRLDDYVIGRTPLEYGFDHYGYRRLTLYLPGYRAHTEHLRLRAPWYAWFPIDLVTEILLPFGTRDRHEVHVALVPDEDIAAEPDIEPLVARARALHAQWEELKEERRAAEEARRQAREARQAREHAAAPGASAPEASEDASEAVPEAGPGDDAGDDATSGGAPDERGGR